VLDVDERSEATAFLRLRDHGQRKRGFAGGFRTENFDDPAAGKSADAQRAINQNVPGRNNVDIDYFVVTETHDGAIAVILGDLLNGEIEIFVAGGGHLVFAGLLSGFSGLNSTVTQTDKLQYWQDKIFAR